MSADYVEPNSEEKREKLDEDFETPFSPPLDMPRGIPVDYPTKDTDMDEMEWYNDGDAAATSTEFPKRVHRSRLPKGFVGQ